MTNITLTHPRDYVETLEENKVTNPVANAVRTLFVAAESEIDRKANFLDAWEQSNNGQG
ncbi:MAG: hypothetical protein H6R18_1543 [Proteobacteria bacterium]|nr:hypothetical protein [Pseudomonadota bacterium]